MLRGSGRWGAPRPDDKSGRFIEPLDDAAKVLFVGLEHRFLWS
jgi:hypothetical protein